jgi:hypothetical protein
MPHEYPISHLYTLAQKTMAFDFAILSHDYAPLYFHEWTDKRAVADGAAVQVAEVRNGIFTPSPRVTSSIMCYNCPMGKLHKLRKAIEKYPDHWIAGWPAAGQYARSADLRKRYIAPSSPANPYSYRQFVRHVLRSLGYDVK